MDVSSNFKLTSAPEILKRKLTDDSSHPNDPNSLFSIRMMWSISDYLTLTAVEQDIGPLGLALVNLVNCETILKPWRKSLLCLSPPSCHSETPYVFVVFTKNQVKSKQHVAHQLSIDRSKHGASKSKGVGQKLQQHREDQGFDRNSMWFTILENHHTRRYCWYPYLH